MVDTAEVIRQAFKDIEDAELRALCQVAETREYPVGTVLCHEGEIEHVFYIVVDGEVSITHRLGPGQQRLIGVRRSGDFFGEMALIEHKPRAATVTTLAPTTVVELSEEVFNDWLARSPRLALSLIRRITANLRATDKSVIADLSEKNAELARAYEDLKAAQAELVAAERLERELEIAGEVQRNLLPTHFPEVPGYSFAGRNVPARQVGGDLYDVMRLSDSHLGLLMADVSDKSVHAALIMAVTRTLFVAHAPSSLSPAEVALRVHNGLLEIADNDDMFVTVFYGVLDVRTGRLCYVRGGQDRPLLFRSGGGPPEQLDAVGRFLGMLPGLTLEEREVQLGPGDLLVAYSDGVPDAINPAIESYGTLRLVSLLDGCRHASAEAVCSAIFDDVFAFRGPAEALYDFPVGGAGGGAGGRDALPASGG
jgi:sigma-B regulation protein RsbU (phosphoserine phosphatase)